MRSICVATARRRGTRPAGSTPDRAARDVIGTLEWLAKQEHVVRPTLLGWSNGSIVSQLAAQRRPELISTLILYGYPRDPANPAPPQTLPPELAREVNTRERAASDFISPKVTPQDVIEAYVAAALAADPVRVDWSKPEQFAELNPERVVTPTLVLTGERDPYAPIDAQSRLFTRLGTPDRQWVILPGVDHAALIEDGHQAFIAAIVAFVSRPGFCATRSRNDCSRLGLQARCAPPIDAPGWAQGARAGAGDTVIRLLDYARAAGPLLSVAVLVGCAPDAPKAGAAVLPTYRDLNHNGQLDRYEDIRLSAEARAADLVKRMSLEEKAGAMMHDTLPGLGTQVGASAQGYDFAAIERSIATRHINSFITRLQIPPAQFAEQNNKLQQIAERTRLGIPVTVSTDPRSHFQAVVGASSNGGGFSQWPETLGFAAIGDVNLVRQFADIARQEYRAVGIHMALSPQADLATEPRWPRVTGTFGSRPREVSAFVGAYIEGFQHGKNGVAPDGVAAVVKHWVGYGAQPEGFDGHNYYGRFVKLSNDTFAEHVAAFQGAFEANVAGVMPAYPIIEGVTLDGVPIEPVAPGFNKQILTDLLRGTHRYRGLILSDWAITRDCDESCMAPTATHKQLPSAIATPWGVEKMSRPERFAKGVNAGLDQFGGTGEVDQLMAAVRGGLVTEARLDESVRRVMVLKFQLGLFDNPFVDPVKAASVVGSKAFREAAEVAQRRAQVVLENRDGVLPVDAKSRQSMAIRHRPRSSEGGWIYGRRTAETG